MEPIERPPVDLGLLAIRPSSVAAVRRALLPSPAPREGEWDQGGFPHAGPVSLAEEEPVNQPVDGTRQDSGQAESPVEFHHGLGAHDPAEFRSPESGGRGGHQEEDRCGTGNPEKKVQVFHSYPSLGNDQERSAIMGFP